MSIVVEYNAVILLIGIFYITIITLVHIYLYYRLKRPLNLLLLFIQIVALFHNISFLYFLYVSNPELHDIRKWINITINIANTIALTYGLLTLISQNKSKYQFKNYILLILLGVVLGLYTVTQSWVLEEGKWKVNFYAKNLTILSFIIVVLFFQYEILIYARRNYLKAKEMQLKRRIINSYRMVYISIFLLICSSLVFVHERIYLKGNTSNYIFSADVACFFLFYSPILYPYVFIPTDINGKSFFLYNRITNIVEEQFIIDDSNYSQSNLSGGISAMLKMMKDFLGPQDIPKVISHKNLTITMESNDTYIAYFISIRPSPYLQSLLTFILNRIESPNFNIKQFIVDNFAFTNPTIELSTIVDKTG